MSILTNFLKLVKPEKNDYVDVEEHISNNLDKIDEKMENFNLNKLDKGGYTGTAQNLLTEISKIASKTVLGRMIVGKGLTVDSSGRTSVVSKNDGIIVNDNNIQLNVYDGVDSSSTTRAGSARAVKQANDNANGRVSKNGDKMTGPLKIKTGSANIYSITYGQNEGDVNFGYRNNIPRIRVSGDGEEANSGFNIEGPGDVILFRVDNNSNLYAGTNLVYHKGNFNPDLKQNKTDSSLKTTSKETTGAINEEYDFARFSLYDGAITPDPKNQGSEYYKYIRSTFVDTLSVLRDAKKLPRLIYFEPQWFTDTADWNYPSHRYEAVVLYAGTYGVKCMVNSPTNKNDIRIICSWNLSDSKKLLSYKIDGYSSGVNAPYEYIQDSIVKSEGKGYIDRTSGKLYYCYKEASAAIISPNSDYFIPATNVELAKGKTVITLNGNSVIKKYDNGLMIQYGVWQEDSTIASKFPIPFIRGFSANKNDPSSNLPLICGATGYGTATDSTISAKVYTGNTNLTQISFVVDRLGSIAYTAIGYWK